jgi:hypothetical protein
MRGVDTAVEKGFLTFASKLDEAFARRSEEEKKELLIFLEEAATISNHELQEILNKAWKQRNLSETEKESRRGSNIRQRK